MRKSRPMFASSTHNPQIRRKKRTNKGSLTIGALICTLVLGTGIVVTKSGSWLGQWTNWNFTQSQNSLGQGDGLGAVTKLISLSPQQRAAELEAIAKSGNGLDRDRARYLLANDLIKQQQGKEALTWLDGLERSYSGLAPYILLKRSQAYEISGDTRKAKETSQDLVKRYPESPATVEALFALSQDNPKNLDKIIAKFPGHPRSLEIARERLKQNSNQPQMLLMLAKYSNKTPEVSSVLDKLVSQYPQGLKSADWEEIATLYWNKRNYDRASAAYIKAPNTAFNAYRVGRGLQLVSQEAGAINAYQYLIAEFPKARETGSALVELGKLSEPTDAIVYLDKAINQFPEKAADALVEKAKIYDAENNTQAAAQTRQLLLTKYANSDALAEYRWNMAQSKAAAKDFAEAFKWAEQITTQKPNSQFAYKATFWAGKWALRLGRKEDAKAAFERAIALYPQSYYAWRSAVFLGWDVGDFTTIRKLNPEVVRPSERPLLPAGSPTLKELYQLGQNQDALDLWQAEFQNRVQPTVPEQFTDGLLQLAVGNHLEGINRISRIEDRETPEEQAQYQELKQKPVYWQALYPFPYLEEIEAWSKEHQLNPLLVTALIRQESRFETNIQSIAGATGLMQMMPSTATWVAQKNNLTTYKLENPKDNIRLGTWFLDHSHDVYNGNSLLAIASYNAGSGNVSKWLNEINLNDPDEFVEAIPFEETNWYVKNVFGNYWNYLRVYNPQIYQQVAKYSTGQSTAKRF